MWIRANIARDCRLLRRFNRAGVAMNRAVSDTASEAPIARGDGGWSSLFTAPKMFLPLAWIFGTLYTLITPPFQVPDEFQHFYRAYQVSEGRLTAYRQGGEVGGDLPLSLQTFGNRVWGNHPFNPASKANIHDIWAARTIPLQPQAKQFFVFGNVSWHSPTNYFPQAAAIAVARRIGLGPLGIFYAGRIGNLLCWSLLVYFSLRLIPIMDWTFLLLALTPMSLAQAASLSADATVNGICFLFVAASLRCAMTEGSIRGAHLIGLTVCAAAVALAKTAYLPLTILFLLIPANRFSSRRRYWLTFAIFMSICLATIVGWSLCTYGAQSYSLPGVSPARQLIFMLGHPIQMVHMEVGMLLAVPFFSDIIGQLGWHEIKLWLPLTALYFGVLFWTTRIGGWPERRMGGRQRIILAAAALACWLAVFSLIYLTFTAVGGHSINGLQGRYMIPATGPFFLLFYPSPRPRRGNPGMFITIFAAGFSVYALLVLVRRFYIW
jgi:uncharacterized membrane protein